MTPQQKDSRASELIEKVKALKERQPYKGMSEDANIEIRFAAENATLGWNCAFDCVLTLLESALKGEDGV